MVFSVMATAPCLYEKQWSYLKQISLRLEGSKNCTIKLALSQRCVLSKFLCVFSFLVSDE